MTRTHATPRPPSARIPTPAQTAPKMAPRRWVLKTALTTRETSQKSRTCEQPPRSRFARALCLRSLRCARKKELVACCPAPASLLPFGTPQEMRHDPLLPKHLPKQMLSVNATRLPRDWERSTFIGWSPPGPAPVGRTRTRGSIIFRSTADRPVCTATTDEYNVADIIRRLPRF